MNLLMRYLLLAGGAVEKNSIDATIFKAANTTYITEFTNILSKIFSCYKIMVQECPALENHEDKIRQVLVTYLNKHKNKLGLAYIFDQDPSENEGRGNIDIKISGQNRFLIDDSYYVIECKRLNNVAQSGTSGLNAKYLKDGVYRFVSGKYSCYHRTNGMIGFIVSEMDIEDNTNKIKTLMDSPKFKDKEDLKIISELKKENFIDGHDFHYSSRHLDKNCKEFILYHLMLDVSKNLRPKKLRIKNKI